jgi:hypothetical protein
MPTRLTGPQNHIMALQAAAGSGQQTRLDVPLSPSLTR